MRLSSYHVHTTFCDGENTAEEMVISAINAKCEEIGFSVHSPLPFADWAIKEERIPEYIETLKALREKYKDKIKIYIGIEQDYFSKAPDWNPDYIIGAVHYIEIDGEYLALDLDANEMKENVDKYYGGDVYSYCEDYFALMADVYNKTKCNIIAHLDLVTKFNEKLPMIDTEHPRYKRAAKMAIDALAKTPAIFEINVGAITRGYRTKPYPDEPLIVEIMKVTDKSFVLNSDSHADYTVAMHLNEYARIFDKIGIPYIKSIEEIL